MEGLDTFVRNKMLKQYSTIFEEELIERILQVGRYDKIYEGHLLIDIDDVLTHVPLLLEGIVKITRKTENGNELILHYLEPGDTCSISFANCIHKRTSIFKGVIESDMEAMFIPIDYIDDWLVEFKSWRHFIIDSYHYRLMEMVDSIDTLAFLKMKSRIWKYLSDKVRISNTDDLLVTHQQIAKDLNSRRVVVTRIINDLHQEGIIFSTRNRVQVLKPFENEKFA